jgi:hypothetical protein
MALSLYLSEFPSTRTRHLRRLVALASNKIFSSDLVRRVDPKPDSQLRNCTIFFFERGNCTIE